MEAYKIWVEQNNSLLMIKIFSSIINYSHYVGVVMFVVIIEWIKKQTQTHPSVWGSKYIAIIGSFALGEPKSLSKTNIQLKQNAQYTKLFFKQI